MAHVAVIAIVVCNMWMLSLHVNDGFLWLYNAGNKVEKVCELAHITLNKNAVFGDSSALAPGGVRVGMFICFCLFFRTFFITLRIIEMTYVKVRILTEFDFRV